MELNFVITILDRVRSKEMAALYESVGAKTTLSMLAHGTATGKQLLTNGLTATEKAVIATAADAEGTGQLMRTARKKMFMDIPGNGIMVSVPIKSVGGGKSLAQLTDRIPEGGVKPQTEFKHELILIVCNEGFNEKVMDIARAAGAGGGTVIPAKGTGKHQPEKFMNISLADEKDMLFIVETAAKKAEIMRAVMTEAGPGTPSGAICFSLPVSAVEGLRRLRPEDAAEAAAENMPDVEE